VPSNKRQTPRQGTTKENMTKILNFSDVIMKNSEDDPEIQKIMIEIAFSGGTKG
jgi:hypothetical protein